MRMIEAALGVAVLCGLVGLSRAGEPCEACAHKHQDCGPGLKKECIFEPVCQPKKKPCYEFEKVDICIPKVRFPWQCCTEAPKCKVKTVLVPVRSSKDCGTETKWKCKVYETCDDSCGKHKKKGCAAPVSECVVVPAPPATEKLPVTPKTGDPMKK